MGEVIHGDPGGGEEQIRSVVGEDPVVLLRHAPVEAAQARLEVGEGQVHLHRGDGGGQGRVRVAVDEDPVRSLFAEHGIEGGEHGAGLHAVAAGADAEVDVWGGDGEVLEERVGHRGVVVLAGVDDDVVDAPAPRESRGHGPELDELRPGTDDTHDLHGGPPFGWVGAR